MPIAALPPPPLPILPPVEIVQLQQAQPAQWVPGVHPAPAEPRPADPAPLPAEAPRSSAPTAPQAPHLLGDWLGARTWLEDKGVKPTATYIWFPALNLNGGSNKTVRQAGQFAGSLAFDMDRIAGIKGGTFQVAITNRNGQNINDTNHLDLLQYPQGVFGAGQIWRLAGLWYQQKIGPAEIKLGQVSMGEDFGSTTCFFQSLYFCGVVPGHTSFNYWYNYPITTWGGRVKVADKFGYTMVGVYQRNDNKFPLNKGFYLGWKGGKGAFVAIERGIAVKLGGDPKRAGLYKVGVFFDTSRSNDLVYDDRGEFAAISGRPYAAHRGRASIYAMGRQQIIAPDDKGAGGLAAFFNFVSADHRTNKLINVITAGVTYSGILPGRPKDEIGLAVGRSRVNGHLSLLQAALDPVNDGRDLAQHDEYAVEATYSIAATPGLSIRPNVQWYINPAGRAEAKDLFVVGTGVFLTF